LEVIEFPHMHALASVLASYDGEAEVDRASDLLLLAEIADTECIRQALARMHFTNVPITARQREPGKERTVRSIG
jgi:Family of unknown function (DUF6307)